MSDQLGTKQKKTVSLKGSADTLERNLIDSGSPVAISQQLRGILLREIAEGVYQAGHRLPSERELSERFEISRASVREAIAALLNEGVLFRTVGRGTFIAAAERRQPKGLGKAMAIGFWASEQIFHFAEPGYKQTLAGVADACRERGYALQFHWVEEHRRSLEQLFGHRVGSEKAVGNIVLGGVSAAVLERLKKLGLPLVTVDLLFPGEDTESVRIDYEQGTRLAMEHLLGLGHRDIGFIGFAASKKYNVYWEMLEAQGVPYRPRYVQFLDPSALAPGMVAGFQGMQKMVAGGELPTAVLITNDYVALGALEALSIAGLKVPDQMSVVSFDDFAQPAVRLTSVRADLVELGRIAVRKLLEPGEQPENAQSATVVPVELVVRGTTGPPTS